ncbi:hypothetical protein GCM10010172_41190 [Paractinoplanes ferrugineus]|uniref:DUF3800 domain-containing protein n=1 Tax=Paractinoplanes ferrugineus TaxID=113564 RepID=A0A919J7P8_9ACTN|nr:hypothetical protein [Actinoplanes ferrugineus]GIE12111.1 hypothetical protein Afe05nite_39510 [Actinoplanes ferrugineus]
MLEIACDESGYEGEKLIGSTTRLFAHASVSLAEPAAVLAELRVRIRSPATEYKANHLLRPQHRRTLRWFLGESGPVYGRGHVFLLDKPAFVRRVFDEHVGGEFPGPESANDILRTKAEPDLDVLRPTARHRAAAFREWLSADPVGRSVLDPLVPAIVAAVTHWGPVTIAHDRQTQLPPRRVEVLKERCPLRDIRFLEALRHPEIQIADILAGTVRALTEAGDPELIHLLPPYTDAGSRSTGEVGPE